MPSHEEAISTLVRYWQQGGRETVLDEWRHGERRRNHDDFFWKTLFEGAMVDGDARHQPKRAKDHDKFEILTSFDQVQEMVATGVYPREIRAFLAPGKKGIGHRWGRYPNGRIYKFLAAAPDKILHSYGGVEKAGTDLLRQDGYDVAKRFLNPVLPMSWKKSQSNFLMMLSIPDWKDDLAVDVRIKNVARAWSMLLGEKVNVNNHAAVVDFFRTIILPELPTRGDCPANLWELDRAMFNAHSIDQAFAEALGLPSAKRQGKSQKSSFCQMKARASAS